jgi:putative hemolysin
MMLRTTVLIALVAPVAAFVSDPSFKVFSKASTALEATTYCQKDGGTLAPIPSKSLCIIVA